MLHGILIPGDGSAYRGAGLCARAAQAPARPSVCTRARERSAARSHFSTSRG